MKKFLLIIFALCFASSAYGADITLTVNGNSLSFEQTTVTEGEEEKEIYTVNNYQFPTINDALDFANDPTTYLTNNYDEDHVIPEDDEGKFSNIAISLEKNNCISGEVNFNYPNISTIEIQGNSHTLDNPGSRHFIFDSSASVSFDNLTINGNDSGGGIEIKSGTANFTNVTFQNSKRSGINGGALNITGGTVTFDSTTFSNNSADNGGALYISGGSVTFSGTTFTSNNADSGGAIYIAGGNTITFSGTNNFNSNNATTGGAVTNASSSMTPDFSGVNFTSNTSTNGGAIAVTAGGANISSTFTNNSADNGGALYITGGTVTINDDTNFTGDTGINGGIIHMTGGTANIYADLQKGQGTNGGAIYIAGGTANVYGALTSNTASENGGAVYLASSSNATLAIKGTESVTISDNTANNGGALYAESNANITIEPEVTFKNNNAVSGDGGALWITDSAQLPTGTVTFEKNEASNNGGAIYSNSSVTLNSSREYNFLYNEASQYGGAIYTLASNITLDGFVVDTENTAGVGGGFAASGTGSIIVQNNSSISNQKAPTGGAIYAQSVTVNNSDLIGNHTENYGTETGKGGGAIFAGESLTVTSGYFEGNYAAQQSDGRGGAIYVAGSSSSDIVVKDSFFLENNTTSYGGAVAFDDMASSEFDHNTFSGNISATDGGAIYTMGENLKVSYCYFYNNTSGNDGGAIYFAQLNEEKRPNFIMNYSMFQSNTAGGDGGGALFIVTNTSTISSCTFYNNTLDLAKNGGAGYGGALYLRTEASSENSSTMDNCTFYENKLDNCKDDVSGGGGLYLYCERSRIRSCTFTLNETAGNGGSAILLDSGILTISGTIALGNTTVGRYDIRVNEDNAQIRSGGYNRIGIFSQGVGEADFKSVTSNNDSDRTSWLNKTYMTSKQKFFGDNELDENRLSTNIPPDLGSSRAPELQPLLTLMLSEDATLPIDDRATNMIPYSRRNSFPALDARGTPRAGSGGTETRLDIGAVKFDGDNTGGGSGENAEYSVSYILISGVPNEIRRVGQTASLVAKVFYTNGRSAYGGTGTDEEPVTWSASPSNYVYINPDTGDLIALTTTGSREGTGYVTVKVSTVRTDSSGNPFTASQPIKITESDFSYLNTSTEYKNYLDDLIDYFVEYNIGFGFADVSTSAVDSSSFQNTFASVWDSSASQVSDLTTTQPLLTFEDDYPESDGLTAVKNAGINIDFTDRQVGDLFPVVYTWNLTGNELTNLIGHDLSSYEFYGAGLAEELFDVLKIEFQGAENILPVIGSGGVNASEALDSGVLVLNNADGNRGVQIELTAYIANVSSDVSEAKISAASSKGSQLIDLSDESESTLLVVPDGVPYDGKIYGTMWLVQNTSSGENISNGSINRQSKTTSSGNNNDSNGGGGCNSFNAAIMLGLLLITLRRKF